MTHLCIIRNAYRIFVGIPEEYLGEKERLQLVKIIRENIHWVNLTHSRLMWLIFTKLMKYQFPSKGKNYIADWITVGFRRGILLHGVPYSIEARAYYVQFPGRWLWIVIWEGHRMKVRSIHSRTLKFNHPTIYYCLREWKFLLLSCIRTDRRTWYGYSSIW